MKMDLALNNLQRLICHKTQQQQQTCIQPYRINRLRLYRVLRSPNECPDYKTEPSNGESLVLDFWGKQCTSLSYLLTPSARAGYDTRSIFKRSLPGLN